MSKLLKNTYIPNPPTLNADGNTSPGLPGSQYIPNPYTYPIAPPAPENSTLLTYQAEHLMGLKEEYWEKQPYYQKQNFKKLFQINMDGMDTYKNVIKMFGNVLVNLIKTDPGLAMCIFGYIYNTSGYYQYISMKAVSVKAIPKEIPGSVYFFFRPLILTPVYNIYYRKDENGNYKHFYENNKIKMLSSL
jgi:hypothetical protein